MNKEIKIIRCERDKYTQIWTLGENRGLGTVLKEKKAKSLRLTGRERGRERQRQREREEETERGEKGERQRDRDSTQPMLCVIHAQAGLPFT